MARFGVKIYIGLVLLAGLVSAQMEYVVMFMENTVETAAQPVELFLSSRLDTQTVVATIDNPVDQLFNQQIVTVQPNQVSKVVIPNEIRHVGSSIRYKTVRVVSTERLIVYALNRNLYSTDGLAVFNVNDLGATYYTVAFYPPLIKTELGIVATAAGPTSIEFFIPNHENAPSIRWTGIDYGPTERFTITLSQYQSVQLQTTTGDISAVRMEGSQNFAAFSGNVPTSIDGTSRDHLVEQLPPTQQWGYQYFITRTPFRSSDRNDYIKIIALNTTRVNISGDSSIPNSITLNKGALTQISTINSLWIQSEYPLLVTMFSSSQSRTSDTDIGDPSMTILPSVGQFRSNYVFFTPEYTKPPNSNTDDYTINLMIVARTAEVNGLRLNSNTLGITWTQFSDSEFSYGYKFVSSNTLYRFTHLNSDARYMALLYGAADRESFAFPIDVGMSNINVITPVEVVGAKGDQGERGPPGITGIEGLKGVKGLVGQKGQAGNKGVQEAQGPKGGKGVDSIGSTGSTGPSGMIGSTGGVGATGSRGLSSGSNGAIGSTGTTGVRGPIGVRGEKGMKGDLGPIGSIGYRGPAGSKGEKGEPGAVGTTGGVGRTGIQGDKGSLDYNGCSVTDACKIVAADLTLSPTCKPTYGSIYHTCHCPPGFRTSPPNWDTCVDIDECALELCSHACVNSEGSFTCSCRAGYTLQGRRCVDINECNSGTPCTSGQTCINGVGSYACYQTSSGTASQTATLSGLQILLRDESFIALLVILIVLTILLAAAVAILIARHRRRYSIEKRQRYLTSTSPSNMFQPFYSTRPMSHIMGDNLY